MLAAKSPQSLARTSRVQIDEDPGEPRYSSIWTSVCAGQRIGGVSRKCVWIGHRDTRGTVELFPEIRVTCQSGVRLPKLLLVLQRLAVGRCLLRIGRRMGLLTPIPAKGCGRVPGVIEISWHARSFSAFRGYRPPKKAGTEASPSW